MSNEPIRVDAFLPNAAGSKIVTIDPARLYKEKNRSDGALKDLALNLVPSLEDPGAIFSGIRDGNADGMCYVVKIHCYHSDTGLEVPSEDFVWCTYVDEHNAAFDWGPEKCDVSERGFPEKYKGGRFQRIIHPVERKL